MFIHSLINKTLSSSLNMTATNPPRRKGGERAGALGAGAKDDGYGRGSGEELGVALVGRLERRRPRRHRPVQRPAAGPPYGRGEYRNLGLVEGGMTNAFITLCVRERTPEDVGGAWVVLKIRQSRLPR